MKLLLCCLIFLYGCKSTEYFISPNEVHKEKVVLYFTDSTKMNGEINIDLENTTSLHVYYQSFVQFIPEGKSQEETVYLKNIIGYSKGADFFALKKIDIYMNNIYNLLFVKRLTSENSKIQLYELYETGRGNNTGESKYSYYLSLPAYGPLETMNTKGTRLIPFFDQKMSSFVSDCPALAKKIKSKERGYFIPMVEFNIKKEPEVLLRIINEYNGCKQTKPGE